VPKILTKWKINFGVFTNVHQSSDYSGCAGMVLCNPSWMYNECKEQELLERFFLEVILAATIFFVT
jgi:hypothetical protein